MWIRESSKMLSFISIAVLNIFLVNVNCVPVPITPNEGVETNRSLIFANTNSNLTPQENNVKIAKLSSTSLTVEENNLKKGADNNKDNLPTNTQQDFKRDTEDNTIETPKIDRRNDDIEQYENKKPLNSAVDNLFGTFKKTFRNILQTGQKNLLRAIGTVDKTVATVHQGVQNSSYAVVLEGQKAAATLYHLAPPVVNRVIQQIGTTRNNRALKQIGSIYNQFRENTKRFWEDFEDHEYHFHNVFTDAWETANKHLGVPPLPRMPFGWY